MDLPSPLFSRLAVSKNPACIGNPNLNRRNFSSSFTLYRSNKNMFWNNCLITANVYLTSKSNSCSRQTSESGTGKLGCCSWHYHYNILSVTYCIPLFKVILVIYPFHCFPEIFLAQLHNIGQNISQLFYFLAQFLFTTNEMELDHYQNQGQWLYVLVMSRTRFRVNPHSIVAWMSRNSLLEAGAKSEDEVTATGLEPRTT